MRVPEIFPRGTLIQLEIIKNGESIRVPATVAYGLPPNVMGLCFGDLAPEQRAVLMRWIEQAIPTLRRPALEKEKVDFAPEPFQVGTETKQKN